MVQSQEEPLRYAAAADVAQLVERNLAKVEVAGSNPVVRSNEPHVIAFFCEGLGSLLSLILGNARDLGAKCLSGLKRIVGRMTIGNDNLERVFGGIVQTLGRIVSSFGVRTLMLPSGYRLSGWGLVRNWSR